MFLFYHFAGTVMKGPQGLISVCFSEPAETDTGYRKKPGNYKCRVILLGGMYVRYICEPCFRCFLLPPYDSFNHRKGIRNEFEVEVNFR